MKRQDVACMLCLMFFWRTSAVSQEVTPAQLSSSVSTQTISLPSSGLGIAEQDLSYTFGPGDFNGDGKYDFLVRVWAELPNSDGEIDETFRTRTYALLNDGTLLWEFNHQLTYGDIGGDPTWTVTLTAWDMDGDGKDEVMTQVKESSLVKLVMLNGMTGAIKKSVSLGNPKGTLHATLAYLDGSNPYLVITYGNSIRTVAYDKNLNEYWRFDNSQYYKQASLTNSYTSDFDLDGRDEIIQGPLLLDDNGALYLDGTSFDQARKGQAARSFVADIIPSNPGREWFLFRAGDDNDPYYVQPNFWEGPYVIDIDQKTVVWHHNTNQQNQGWGRSHRGWLSDMRPDDPGLEMQATGYYWEGSEWQNALNGVYGTPPGPDDSNVKGYSERYFLYNSNGGILRKVVGDHTGYPVYWDDDDGAEYFQFRAGKLLSTFEGSVIESGFARAYGSGESIEVDIRGDWREEIIVASGYKLYIYENNSPTNFPNRRSPRTDHDYLMNMASLGTGLPKPISHNSTTWTEDGPPLPAPTITSFTPDSGPAGTQVTLTGTNFTGATSVKFNATAAVTFSVDADTQIRANVPANATTGKISVTTAGGTTTSALNFTVTSGGTGTTVFLPTDDAHVKSTSPTSKFGANTTIRLVKKSAETINSYLKFSVSGLSGAVQSAKLRLYVTDASNDGGSVFGVSNNYAGTSTPWVESGLNWNNAPAISGTALSNVGVVSVGTWVELEVTAAVTGNGTYNFALANNSSDIVHYSSKEGANKPELLVQIQAGQPPPPTISSFTPASGPVGTEVIITGANFSGVSSVKFNGAPAATFVVDSQTQIRATVPAGATSGKISVTTGGGTAMSATNFTVTAPAPSITSFTPASGPVGTEVTITGNSFNGVSSVQFNGAPAASFVVDSETQIRATVPAGATSGQISVATGAGTALSATDFTVTVNGVTTTSFTPSADTYVKKSSSGTNYGSNSDLRVRLTSSDMLNTYLKFQISGLSGTVQSAKLRLYVYDASNDGGALYSVSNNYANSSTAWTESGLTWSNAPSLSGTALGSAGAVSAGSWVEFEVTAIITGNGTYSFGLKSNSSDLVVYTSRSTSNKPELIVQTAVASIAARDHAETLNEATALPREFALHQNYPNPFNPQTRIDYDLPEATDVSLTVYDILSREVAVLVEGRLLPGSHHAFWDGRNHHGVRVSAGLYFYSLRANHFKMVRKMTLLQ